MYCIDASVLINAFKKEEKYSYGSIELLLRARQKNISIFLPETVIPETAAAISRGTGNETMALQFVGNLRKLSNITFISVDRKIADLSADIAAEKKIKGSDSIYVAVALEFNARLITLDKEQESIIQRYYTSINSSRRIKQSSKQP